tara:strand:+ start:865 stop:1611 length:747 start_codon:yes stop_codon:yes gene_type:complete
MIRNYYTESYKGGVTPVVSATQLIDGTVKIIESTTATSVVNAATSVTLVLTLNAAIKRGMYITCPTMAPVISINTNLIVEQVVHGANTTVTLNTATVMQAGQVLTFFAINQNSWKEYNLYIADSPSTLPVTTTTDNLIVSTSVNVGLASANPLIKAGMYVKGTGLPAAGIEIASVTSATAYVLDSAQSIAANATLTYTYITEASVSVLTADNRTLTFARPAEGFVLPVSVVQVTAATGGVENNLIALE